LAAGVASDTQERQDILDDSMSRFDTDGKKKRKRSGKSKTQRASGNHKQEKASGETPSRCRTYLNNSPVPKGNRTTHAKSKH
jgi:hypothetical protein